MNPQQNPATDRARGTAEKTHRAPTSAGSSPESGDATISIVIVTHNSRDFVDACLHSIRRYTVYPRYEVWVVDNDSRDDTRQLVAKYCAADQRVRLIRLASNLGFAAATNIGAARAGGEFLVMLNIDTVVTSGWLGRLVRHVEQDPNIGAVIAVTNSTGNEARINIPYRTPAELQEFSASLAQQKEGQSLEIAVAPLYCVLTPRKVWDQAGGLDPRFKIGMFEDDDFSLKIRESGLKIVCAEDCFVHHFGRGAFGRLSQSKYQAVFERNLRRFEQKWERAWQPHTYRDGLRGEDHRFSPEDFLVNAPPAIAERLAKKDWELQETRQQRDANNAALSEQEAALEEKDSLLRQKETLLTSLDQALAERNTRLAQQEQQLSEQSGCLAEQTFKAQRNEAELKDTRRALAAKNAEAAQLGREREAARLRFEERAKQLEAEQAEARLRFENREKQLEAERVEALHRLDHAETIRARTQVGLNEYRTALSDLLRQYRSQRAWQVMLLIRKAYRLIVREGAKGTLALLGWFVRFLAGKDAGLGEEELPVPDIRDYVPGGIQKPFQEASDDAVPSAADQKKKYDVIFLPVFDFDFRYQRPQQLAAEFGRQGRRVFWISPFKQLPLSADTPFEVTLLRENIWEVQLRAPGRDIFRGKLQHGDADTFGSCLVELCNHHGIDRSVALLQLPFWRQIGLELRRRAGSVLVYDCIDDWDSMPGLGAFNAQEETKLTRECDLMIVTGQGLAEKHARSAKRAPLLVRNAADFEHFSGAEPNQELAPLSKPIVGYFGAIADWFDFDLIRKAARERPNYSFVLIGGYGVEQDLEAEQAPLLRGIPNLFLYGHKDYASLPSYLAHFDVAIIPFVMNPLTRATDPVKMYEYFSQGRPVVATQMPELAHCADLVYLADDAGDFCRKLDLALAEQNPELAQRRISFASRHTWTDRYETMDKAIRESAGDWTATQLALERR